MKKFQVFEQCKPVMRHGEFHASIEPIKWINADDFKAAIEAARATGIKWPIVQEIQ